MITEFFTLIGFIVNSPAVDLASYWPGVLGASQSGARSIYSVCSKVNMNILDFINLFVIFKTLIIVSSVLSAC